MWMRCAGAVLILASLVAAVALAIGLSSTRASNGGMDAMSIDLDTSGNTATTLGPRDRCQEVQPGQTVTLDVTATNIPASNPMIGFGYYIQYNDSALTIKTQNHQFLLAATPGSALLNVSQPTPDTDGSNDWGGSSADFSTTAPEFGSGVISRLTIAVGIGTSPAQYNLTLTGAGHVDHLGDGYAPDILNGADIAVGVACPPPPSATYTPSPPAPTPTPIPTPSATPNPLSLSIAYDDTASISVRNNTVTVRGTLTCSAPVAVDVDMGVIEYVKGSTVVAAPATGSTLACAGAVNWALTAEAEGGRVKPGDATVVVTVGTHEYGGQIVGASGPIRLKAGAH